MRWIEQKTKIWKKVIYAEAPCRIDFAGGTTDVWPIPALLKKFDLAKSGAVLNAAIEPLIRARLIKTEKGIEFSYRVTLPPCSGLGASAAMNLVWFCLVKGIKQKELTKRKRLWLSEKVAELETLQGLVEGKQDQLAAALGGINLIEFIGQEQKGQAQDKAASKELVRVKVKVKPIKLQEKVVKQLESRLSLWWIPKRQSSSDLNQLIIKKASKNKGTLQVLAELSQLASYMAVLLKKQELDKFASNLNEEWKLRKKLHVKVSSKEIEKVISKGLRYAQAAKLCGSAGGGSILFYSEPEKKQRLRQVFSKLKLKEIKFKFNFTGLRIY